jgi:hypothetical protein
MKDPTGIHLKSVEEIKEHWAKVVSPNYQKDVITLLVEILHAVEGLDKEFK